MDTNRFGTQIDLQHRVHIMHKGYALNMLCAIALASMGGHHFKIFIRHLHYSRKWFWQQQEPNVKMSLSVRDCSHFRMGGSLHGRFKVHRLFPFQPVMTCTIVSKLDLTIVCRLMISRELRWKIVDLQSMFKLLFRCVGSPEAYR